MTAAAAAATVAEVATVMVDAAETMNKLMKVEQYYLKNPPELKH